MERSRSEESLLPATAVVSSFGWTRSLILDWEGTLVVSAPVTGYLAHDMAAGFKRNWELIP